eukprot:gene10714-7445_t
MTKRNQKKKNGDTKSSYGSKIMDRFTQWNHHVTRLQGNPLRRRVSVSFSVAAHRMARRPEMVKRWSLPRPPLKGNQFTNDVYQFNSRLSQKDFFFKKKGKEKE